MRLMEDYGIWTNGQLFSKAAQRGKQIESGTVGLWKTGSLRDFMPDVKQASWPWDGDLREVYRM